MGWLFWTALLGLGALVLSGSGSMSGYVPPTRTPVTPAQMYAALASSWPDVIGDTPTRSAILVLLSQWSVETDTGRAMIQWNVGNFKATSSSSLYTTYLTTEVVNGEDVHLDQNFAAYPDLASGVTAYLQAMHGRFGAAWSYVESGDLDGFAQALKNQGYYTRDEPTYAAALHARYSQLDAEIPDDAA